MDNSHNDTATLRNEDDDIRDALSRPSNIVTLDRPRAETKPTVDKPAVETPVAPPTAKAPAEAPAAPPAQLVAPKKKSRRGLVLPVILIAILGGGGWYGYQWWTNGRFIVSTDDAYVQADVATLGTKVSGYVASVPVNDGDHVKAGDVLVKLDDTDYKLTLVAAQAKRATATATLARIDQQIVAQGAQIDSAQAGISSAEAAALRTTADYDRVQSLIGKSFSTKAQLDQATADRDQAAAAVINAKAALAAAQANLSVIKAQRVEAEASAKELDTAVTKAQSDLDATTIRAPDDGVIGNRAAEPGQYISPGSRLMALVPMKSVYIAANFKETQLGSLKPGQPVSIEVDSISGRVIQGRIESLSPASGSTFSLLPPENATGNFTKIVQRLPVRVAVTPEVAAEGVLRPGLSAVVSVDSRSKPGDQLAAD